MNGEPVVIAILDGDVLAAMLVAVANGEIRHVLFQADPNQLSGLEPRG